MAALLAFNPESQMSIRSVLFTAMAAALLSACGSTGGPDGKGPDGNGSCTHACAENARACDGAGFKVCEVQPDGCRAWSAITACASNEICDTGACRKNCVDNCGPGTSLCEGSGFRACEQKSNGCYDWAPVSACAASQVCSGGTCANSCSNQCSEGARQCTSTGTVTCQLLSTGCTEWVAPANCPAGQVCSGGECVPNGSCSNQCTEGASRCTVSGQQQDCVKLASGCTDWTLPKTCSAGQSCPSNGDACVEIACTAGQTRCGAGTAIETCSAQGVWVTTSTCPQACSNGACSAAVTCSPGALRCNANAVEACNSAGTAWLHSQTCTSTCSGGMCTGPCASGEKRCNGNVPETCNATGTAWTAGSACSTSCFKGDCTQADLLVDGVTVTMDGEHRFTNSVVVRNGGKLQVGASGQLRITAPLISVDSASSVSANGVGSGDDYTIYMTSPTDLSTAEGYSNTSTPSGGGVIDLRGNTITIDGQVTANASATYSCGGTVLLAADNLLGAGALQAVSTSSYSYYYGVVKLLHGAQRTLNASAGYNQITTSLMPPMTLVSSTHPDPAKTYNDGADTAELAWERPFSSVNGYYYRLSNNESDTVTPANGTFIQAESVSIPLTGINSSRYFHIVSVDANANVGQVRNVFPLNINWYPPSVSSSSHPSPGQWYANTAAYLSWTSALPSGDGTGYYYVLDKFGDTVPTAANGVFTTNPQVLLSNLTPGTWVFHLVERDSQLRTTRMAASYKLFIGTEPATGNLSGSVFDGSNANAPLAGVDIVVNRGLFETYSTSSGTYTFNNAVYEGTWEVTASRAGYKSVTRQVTITGGQVTNENFVLVEE